MGWFPQADDAYYTYRMEKRKIREKHDSRMERLKGKAEKWFLEIPFGYGVKPFTLLCSFIVLWFFFAICYLFFIQREDTTISPRQEIRSQFKSYLRKNWWKPWKHAYLILVNNRFAWALIHSLDNITPGINFRSIETMNPYKLVEKYQREIIYLQRFQQIIGWYLLVLLLTLFSRICLR